LEKYKLSYSNFIAIRYILNIALGFNMPKYKEVKSEAETRAEKEARDARERERKREEERAKKGTKNSCNTF
jgi:hypothetical protein